MRKFLLIPLLLIETVGYCQSRKDYQTYYDRGKTIEYYSTSDLSINARLNLAKSYGRHYFLSISIKNKSNKEIVFLMDNLHVTITVDGEAYFADILTYDQYMKKVRRKQKWNMGMAVYGEYSEANSAGKYSSNSTINGNGYSGTISTSGNNNSATYAARQNAKNNVQNYNNEQSQIANNISESYLNNNTIFPGTSYSGYVAIKPSDGEIFKVELVLDRITYIFSWKL